MKNILCVCVVTVASIPTAICAEDYSRVVPLAGVTYDVGSTASSYGVGFGLVWETVGMGGFSALQVLPTVQMITRDHHQVDTIATLLTGRASIVGDMGCYSVELALGVDMSEGVGMLQPGAFFGVYYFDIGYTYALSFSDRPDWLNSHQFGLRVNLPL